MDPKIGPEERLQAALASLQLQDKPNYPKVAKQFSVNQTTLSQQYCYITKLYLNIHDNKHFLLHIQLKALIKYINDFIKRKLPPTNTIVYNFRS